MIAIAERSLQGLAVLALWLVCVGNRELVAISAAQLVDLGDSLPLPTRFWFALAGDWVWVIPALASLGWVVVIRRAPKHANCIAAVCWLLATAWATLGQWAAQLPMLSPCAPIV